MLSALHIENIAVIKSLDVDFSSGLSVLTGETGAGKSIVIGSVRMLLGSKTDRDVIRKGEEEATVEGLFCGIDAHTASLLEECGVSPDANGELFLRRKVTSDGRSACRINGRTVPLQTLKTAGALLLGIHGQHDTQTLLDEEMHLTLLDRYGKCDKALESYRQAYRASVELKGRLASLLKEENEKERLIEKCRKTIEDISSAKLKKGEEETLETRKKLVRDAQKLTKQARIVYRALYKNEKGGSAVDLMEIAQTALEQLSDVLPESEEYVEKLTNACLELEEIAHGVSALTEIGSENPTEELNRIEDRLDLIKSLKRKYGDTVEEILQSEQTAKEQLEELEGRDKLLFDLRAELEKAVERARNEGEKLGALRKKAAEQLEKAVNGQVAFLDLDKVKFKIEVTDETTAQGLPKLTANGRNAVRFLIVTNPGEPFKPLSSIASGGELSRIMLALKVALADKESTPTLVFDEIDTGVSGKTAQKIGMKLREIGGYTQVFCVTHSAQVAACGHHHYKISKEEADGRSVTKIEALDRDGKIAELSRIMGGIHITESVRKSAEELYADGQK